MAKTKQGMKPVKVLTKEEKRIERLKRKVKKQEVALMVMTTQFEDRKKAHQEVQEGTIKLSELLRLTGEQVEIKQDRITDLEGTLGKLLNVMNLRLASGSNPFSGDINSSMRVLAKEERSPKSG